MGNLCTAKPVYNGDTLKFSMPLWNPIVSEPEGSIGANFGSKGYSIAQVGDFSYHHFNFTQILSVYATIETCCLSGSSLSEVPKVADCTLICVVTDSGDHTYFVTYGASLGSIYAKGKTLSSIHVIVKES